VTHTNVERARPASRRHRSGFTLLEASIVLVVISILMTVAVAAFQPNDIEHLKACGDILAADLRLAQSIAVRDNTEITLRLTDAGWAIEHTGSGSPPTIPPPLVGGIGAGYEVSVVGLVGRPVTIVGRLSPSNAARPSVTFTGTGRTVSVEKTVFWLTLGTGDSTRSLPLTVAPYTGFVSAGELVQGSPAN
jgi:prepilin-type N-terminal cleavage/methylation domain-containing protein